MANGLRSRAVRTAALVLCVALLILAAGSPAFAQYSPFGEGTEGPSTWRLLLTRILPMLLGVGVGFAIGALCSPAMRQFRRYAGIFLAAVIVLYALFGKMPTADVLSYIIGAILFFVALNIGLRLGEAFAQRSRPTSLGSAQWADLNHLRANGIIGRDGFVLGEFVTGGGKNAFPLHYKGERHLLTVAPTRSGKGVSSIIPNLLTYPGSVFIIDPKGENALITAFRRGPGSVADNIPGMGQNVVLVDPWNVAASKLKMKPASFNPLDWIKADDPDCAENAFLLADALVMTESQSEGEARFWDEEAKALLTGIILYIGTAKEEEGNRTLGRVRDLLTLNDDDFRVTLNNMYKHPHPIVRSTAARQASKDTKLFSSVLAGAQSHTHFLDSGRIRESLARSDFRFEDMKTKPMSVYLILPADRLKTFDRWLRLLIQQSITVNARNVEQKPEKAILFLLDEMPTLGRLPALEQAFGLMAGFGMQLWGIVQDLSQLARVYGEHGWQTFISNSGVIQYFGSRDKMTAEYFSTLCGVTTVEIHNFSWAVGKAISFAHSVTASFTGGGSSTSSVTDSTSWTRTSGTSEAQRQLAYPDELMVLKGHQQIVFVENLDPIPAKKLLWYENPVLKKLGVNLNAKFGKKVNAIRKPDNLWSYTERLPEPASQQTLSYDLALLKKFGGHFLAVSVEAWERFLLMAERIWSSRKNRQKPRSSATPTKLPLSIYDKKHTPPKDAGKERLKALLQTKLKPPPPKNK